MILFAWRRLPPPGFIGGAEISEGLVARSLAAAGENVTFVGATSNPRDPSESWRRWLLELLDHHDITYDVADDYISYRWHGVECHATSQDRLLGLVGQLVGSARVLWTSQEDCPAIRAVAPKLPAASYAHSVSKVGLLSAQLDATLLAPSRFVQQVIAERFGVRAHLLRPPLPPELPHTGEPRARDLVLFVNPIRDKGVQVAAEIARQLPTTKFVFVESWRTADADLRLPANVRLLARMPSLNALYQRARLLLVPSLIDDACPRVILEAGTWGTPTVGPDRGGIAELIADPDNVLPADDPDAWAERCRYLLVSPIAWSTASDEQHQLAHSMRTDPAQRLSQLGFPPTAATPTT